MATFTTVYKLGDLSNGDFAEFATEEEAMEALEEAIADGTLANIEVIGELGCPWETEEDAREASEEFFYVKQVTEEREEDSMVVWEHEVVIAGNIQ